MREDWDVMPQDVDFALPWPLRVSPYLNVTRERNIAWMQRFGLLARGDKAVSAYLGWRLAEVAAYFYPEATREGLELATDLMGWYFAPFDDQFDGPLGKDPARVARVCGGLVDSLQDAAPKTAAPSVLAFADIWRRCRTGMSAAWCARAAVNWADYFVVHVAEAQLRCGTLPQRDREAHMWRRRRSNGAFVVYDVAERVSAFELPPVLWHHPVLREMRDVAADVVTLCQDTTSVEKEERAADHRNNLLLILEADCGMSRREAISEAQRQTAELVRRFQALEVQADNLGHVLSAEHQVELTRYVRHLHDWMRGHDVWAAQCSRYDADLDLEAGREAAPAVPNLLR